MGHGDRRRARGGRFGPGRASDRRRAELRRSGRDGDDDLLRRHRLRDERGIHVCRAALAAVATRSRATGSMKRPAHVVMRRVVLPLVGVACVLAVWQATLSWYRLPPIVLPSPWSVATTLVELVHSVAFWRDVVVSLFEFVCGYP